MVAAADFRGRTQSAGNLIHQVMNSYPGTGGVAAPSRKWFRSLLAQTGWPFKMRCLEQDSILFDGAAAPPCALLCPTSFAGHGGIEDNWRESRSPLLAQGGWLRPLRKCRGASLAGADGEAVKKLESSAIPLLASLQGGVAERFRKYREASAYREAGVVFR